MKKTYSRDIKRDRENAKNKRRQDRRNKNARQSAMMSAWA